MVQWIRIHLPMQGTWVRPLVCKDSTCRGASKPMHSPYRACTLKPSSHNYGAWVLQLLKPVHLKPALHKRSHCSEKPANCKYSSPRSLQLEKACVQQRRHSVAKTQQIKKEEAELTSSMFGSRGHLLPLTPGCLGCAASPTTPLQSFCSEQGCVLDTGGPGWDTLTKGRHTVLSSKVLKGRHAASPPFRS